MYDFAYHRPDNLDDAANILKANPEATLLAGGMTLIPTLKLRLANPSDVVDLSAVDSLNVLKFTEKKISVGAMTTHSDVSTSKKLMETIPGLSRLAKGIGDPHVRHRGTIGGSVANNDPAADYPAAVLALNANINTISRTINADEFFTGQFATVLEETEIITSIDFPIPRRSAYEKFSNPASRYAIVGVMVADTEAGIRVAVTGAGSSVFRATKMEEALALDFSADAIADISLSADDLSSDLHASSEYRAHLISVMAMRAVNSALTQ